MAELFTVEETNLMCIYGTGSRLALIDALMDAMGEFEDDELFELAVRTADKLSMMSDADFAELNPIPEYEETEADDGGE
jgi:hypothetical protein